MTGVIAFDVNETLLDLSSLDVPFADVLGSASLRPQWFAQMLQLSFVGGLTGEYIDFTTAQRAALRMIAIRAGRKISDEQVTEMVDRMRSLPAHPEVDGALSRLEQTAVKVVALANSPLVVVEAQLRYAGIRTWFDAVISADSVRRLKPAPEPYVAVARRFNVARSEVRLVAAHGWDISGALAAGCKAAFVARPAAMLSPIGKQPDIVGSDIAEVVEMIVRRELQ